jgi:hypothetical protein
MSSARLTYPNVVATLCLIALVGAGAVAAVAQSGGQTMAACYKTKGKTKGAMRYLAKASDKCKKGEKKVTWNQQGPQGVAGEAGARGAAGPAGADAVAPSGAVMFFDLAACPAGWTAYEPARGRYVVGLNAGGAQAATVGTPLGDKEDRPVGMHEHGITDPGHSHEIRGSGAALRVPSSVISFAGRGVPGGLPPSSGPNVTGIVAASTGVAVNPSGTVSGTAAPYVQLLACRKG